MNGENFNILDVLRCTLCFIMFLSCFFISEVTCDNNFIILDNNSPISFGQITSYMHADNVITLVGVESLYPILEFVVSSCLGHVRPMSVSVLQREGVPIKVGGKIK